MREGWKLKNIGEVSTILNGGTPKTKILDYWDGDIAWITPADLGKNHSKYVCDTSRKITKLGLEKSSAKLFPSNSIVLSTRAPIGHIAINTIDMSTNQGCRGIVPLDKCDTEYLYYFLFSKVDLLNSLGTGATFRELSTKSLASVPIPIPPLSEQKQIVALLDKVFAAIDKAKANIEKNIENARELFQSKLNITFEKFSSISNIRKLGSLLETLTDYHANGSYKVLKENVELKDKEDFAWMVRSTDFENGFKNQFKYIDEHAYNHLSKSKIFGGEIIISKIGNAGKVYIMPQINRPCSLAMNLFLLRLNNKEMTSEYLYYYLQSTLGEKQILSKLNGTTTKTITKDSVRDLNIPMIEVNLQIKTINEFNELKNKIKNLEQIYINKMTHLEELKKSILQKAFSGELTKTKELSLNQLDMVAEETATYNANK